MSTTPTPTPTPTPGTGNSTIVATDPSAPTIVSRPFIEVTQGAKGDWRLTIKIVPEDGSFAGLAQALCDAAAIAAAFCTTFPNPTIVNGQHVDPAGARQLLAVAEANAHGNR